MADRIVHYLWSAETGGIGRLVLDLVNEQRSSGSYEVEVLIGMKKGENGTPGLLEATGAGCVYAGLSSGFDFSPARVRRLTRYLKRADLVHLHSFHPTVSLCAVRAGIPILYTEHGTFGVGRRHSVGDRLKKPMKSWLLSHYAGCVSFNSRYTRDAANSLYGISGVPQRVVYNGTSLSDEHLDGREADAEIVRRCKGRTVVGTFSRFTERKKIDRLLRAFADLEESCRSILLLVGDGPEMERLTDLTASLDIGDRVVFTGYKPNINAYIALMDICVFPAEKEPFGLAAIEALARGKPAIVFHDGGGLTEIAGDLEREDIAASLRQLSERISYYCRNPVEREGAAALRQEYVKRFAIERMAESFSDIYSELLATRGVGKNE